MRSLKSFSFIVLLIFLVVFKADAAEEKNMPFTAEWKNELLTIDAENVPLNIILGEISRRTGIMIYGQKNLQETKTVHFSKLPLNTILHDLLKPTNYYRIHVTSFSEDTSPYILLSKNNGLDNNIIITTLMSNFTNTAIRLSASQEESSSSLVLLNKSADVNKNIINVLIKNFIDTHDAGALKKETGDSDSKKIPDASLQVVALDSDEEKDATEEDGKTDLIKEQLHHPEPEVRITALLTMAYDIDADLALEAAQTALKDKDAKVRSIAEEIIREFNDNDEEAAQQ